MKKIILITLTLVFTLDICFSQDTITKKSGVVIQAKVIEVGQTEIKYKKFDYQNGPTYVILKSDVLMIRYENGTKDIFIESDNSIEQTDTINDEKSIIRQYIITHRKFKNRLCINIGGGSGFKDIPVATLTNGTETSISFGGGSLVKLVYGCEIRKHFDMAIDFGFQLSELDIPMNNGSMTFSRNFISVTPSYILPIGRKDRMNIKFGVGIDWLFNTSLKMELSKIPGGIDDNWKYNNTIGEHLKIVYEIKMGKRFSIDAGLKLYNANYKFESGGNYYPNDNVLKTPDGSGLDILFGLNYHFNWIK